MYFLHRTVSCYLILIVVIGLTSGQQPSDCVFKNCDCQTEPQTLASRETVVTVNCDGTKFADRTQFPVRVYQIYEAKIKTLEVVNFNLSSVSDYAFSNLNIESVSLRRNGLTSISINAFMNVNGLSELDLSENRFADVYKEQFSNMKNLRILSLARNRLKSLSTDFFDSLPSLESIDLSENEFEHVDNRIFQPIQSKLESIYLAQNRFTSLPDVSYLKQLNYVDLSENGLTTIDSSRLPTSLTSLIMTNNKIDTIRKNDLGSLTNLIYLDLSANQIYNIEKDSFGKLTQLHVLRLAGNRIGSLPDISKLNNLAEIDLSNQNVARLDAFAFDRVDTHGGESFFSILNRIDLSNNKIESIDAKAFCTRHVAAKFKFEFLLLSQNPIKNFDVCALNEIKPDTRSTIIFYSNNSTTPSEHGNNCNCDIVNYLIGLNINLISDCDLNPATRCSRIPPTNSTLCVSHDRKYDCASTASKSTFSLVALSVNFFLIFNFIF